MTEAELVATFRKADAGDIDAMKLSFFYLLELARQFLEADQIDVFEKTMAQAAIYKEKALAVDPTWLV